MDLSVYRSDLPYPEVPADIHRADALCLKNDYAGRTSETTAVLTYMYQHYILGESRPQTARLLKGIAITEMHHHELLGKAIFRCGGDPVIAGTHCFWSGSNIRYLKDPLALLRMNIEAEKQAIADYRRTILCLRSPEMAALIERIIADEEVHIRLFEEEIDRLSGRY